VEEDININIIPIPNKRIKDLTGFRFNKLVVKGYVGKNEHNSALWLCRCDCILGKYKIVITADLKSNHVKSCGCLSNELLIERNKTNIRIKHGKSRTRIYRIWQGIKTRCENLDNKRYKDYGGRGITYCKDWEYFEKFQDWAIHNGYTKDLTIDRIDVDGNYEPNNCRWVTNKVQQNNKRYHHLLSYDGKIQNLAQWSEETGLPYNVIWKRIKMGWDIKKILTPIATYLIDNEEEVKNIIELFNVKKCSMRQIATLYNISHSHVSSILKRNEV
jgi:hypothetical protein